jgi:NADPH:quinone reductase-like Zn-dependent oxidoreductase
MCFFYPYIPPMKAITLVKHGKATDAFEFREVDTPQPNTSQVLIKVEAFGLNFADVMARYGLYGEAPKLPSVLGYEVVGKIESIGSEIKGLTIGQRVVAFTRFGGYAQYALAEHYAITPIPETMDIGTATALATQYCTAFYASEIAANLQPGEHVLIQAAAGGVGIALVQLAKRKNCTVYGTASNKQKLDFLKSIGVDYPINYITNDFHEEVKKIRPQGIDVAFDSVGGKSYKKSRKLLAFGGRLLNYGAAESMNGASKFSLLKTAFSFGWIHPVPLMMQSKAVMGVNMLRIAEHKPSVLQHCLKSVVAMTIVGELKPHTGGIFDAKNIADAHHFLENRGSIGKVVVKWE